MSQHQTIDGLRARHQREERRLIIGALERNGWKLAGAAAQLDVAPTSLLDMIRRHGLGVEYESRNAGRGRPRVSPNGRRSAQSAPGERGTPGDHDDSPTDDPAL